MKRDSSYLIGNQFAKGSGPNSTSFKKGFVPWNKGMKGWCPPGSRSTQFKKGQKSTTKKPIGFITIRSDKNGKKRRWIKTGEPNKWTIYSQWNWVNHNGAIPEGYMVHHADGNSLNDDVSNYKLVTRSQHINEHRAELVLAYKAKRLISIVNK